MSVTVSSQVCTWCVGDLRPVDGAPTVMICVFCGSAVSLHGEVPPTPLRALIHVAPENPLLITARVKGKSPQRAA